MSKTMIPLHGRPEKRCDICLYRRAQIRISVNEALRPINAKIVAIGNKLARERNRKRPNEAIIKGYEDMTHVWQDKSKEIRSKGYADVCPICAEEPRILVRGVSNKWVAGTPDEICLDCPSVYEEICRFMELPMSDKEARRRERLIDKYGRLKLC